MGHPGSTETHIAYQNSSSHSNSFTHRVKRLLNSILNPESEQSVEDMDPICVAVIPLVLASLITHRKQCVAAESLTLFTKSSQRINFMPDVAEIRDVVKLVT